MTITKLKTSYGTRIERAEVLRETEQSVYLPSNWKGGERREAKATDFHQYHDSWEAAHAYLVEKAQEAIACARRRLQAAHDEAGNVKGLKKPKGA